MYLFELHQFECVLYADCFYESRKYQGAYETTITGATCVDWSMVFYQESMAYMFPDATLRDAKNRCRDPDGSLTIYSFFISYFRNSCTTSVELTLYQTAQLWNNQMKSSYL